MADIKRINLSFNVERQDDLKAYNILNSQRNKTAFIIEVILSSKEKEGYDSKLIKRLIKEALEELNLKTSTKLEDYSNEDDIPDSVFDLLSNI